MTVDPALCSLVTRFLDDGDQEAAEIALVEVAALLDMWSRTWETKSPRPLGDGEARAFLLSKLMECIDRDPKRPLASTAIWVLGKLHDASLEPYLVKLAVLFLHDDQMTWHLRQTVIALDNLEVFISVHTREFLNRALADMAIMRAMVSDYVQNRPEEAIR